MSDNLHILHEAPSQRRTHRLNAPITIVFDAMPYRTIDWSLLDFKIADYYGALEKGQSFSVIIQIPYQGFNVSFQANARVVTNNQHAHTLACEFFDIDERSKEILETFVAGLVRGEMETIKGVIRRMDVPVTPASLKPDIALTEAELKAQDRKRTVGSILYLTAGCLFLAALLTVMYTNIFQIKVETAVMAAPTDILIAPATGEIAKIHVQERQHVKAEENIITVTDPELEQNIERAALHLKETSTVSSHDTAASPETEAIRSSIRALQQSLNVRAAALNRMKQMAAQGLAVRLDYDRTEGEYFQAKAELSKAMERLNALKTSGNNPATLSSIAEGELNLLKDQRARLSIKAPTGGSIIHLMQREGTSVRYGDPVAIFEHSEPHYVEANLTREEALSVAIGDIATVFFPSHNQDADFQVSDIDYASKLVSRRDGMYVMRLIPMEKNKEELIKHISPGTSAVVVFNKIKWGSNSLPPASTKSTATPSTEVKIETQDPISTMADESVIPMAPIAESVTTSVTTPATVPAADTISVKASSTVSATTTTTPTSTGNNIKPTQTTHIKPADTKDPTTKKVEKSLQPTPSLPIPSAKKSSSEDELPDLPDMKLLDEAIKNAQQNQ
jgi:multidrug resistance efflux pump